MKVLCLIGFLLIPAVLGLSENEATTIKNAIISGLRLVPSYNLPCNPCQAGDIAGAVLRLVFHDAFGGGGPRGRGGMNGCLDWNSGHHNGLQAIVATLEGIRRPYASMISRADFWLLAGRQVIRYATMQANTRNVEIPSINGYRVPAASTLRLDYKFGRKDESSCNDKGRLPGASLRWSEISSMFSVRAGLNTAETVALMGAHSLGRAQSRNSGFEGGWTPSQSTFSNIYYHGLARFVWQQNGRDSWSDPSFRPNLLALRTDVEMLFDSSNCRRWFNLKAESGSCPLLTRNGNPSQWVLTYASDVKQFYKQFENAWEKMTEMEYSNLRTATRSSRAESEEQVDAEVNEGAETTTTATLSPAAIGGIVAGLVGLVVIVVVVIVVVWKRKSGEPENV